MIKVENSPLLKYARNYHSQFGEDGILEKIFSVIGPTGDRWCVEFGAWDGVEYSNTRHLIAKKDWHGVLIEPVKRRFTMLVKNNIGNERVFLINKFVAFSGKNSLNNILRSTPIPIDFDLLSIDIDGNDFHIWKSFVKYHPKVVVVEYNQTIPPRTEFVQPRNFSKQQGSSLYSFVLLGKKKGYELVVCTETNAIFISKEYYPLFKINNNSPEVLMPKEFLTTFFQLSDGTLVLRGCKRLLWHNLEINDEDIQVIPKYLRRFPTWYTVIITRVIKGKWRELYEIIRKNYKRFLVTSQG